MSYIDRNEPKVISLLGPKKQKNELKNQELDQESGLSLKDVMMKNMKNKERLKRDRLKANESVLKSYKIK